MRCQDAVQLRDESRLVLILVKSIDTHDHVEGVIRILREIIKVHGVNAKMPTGQTIFFGMLSIILVIFLIDVCCNKDLQFSSFFNRLCNKAASAASAASEIEDPQIIQIRFFDEIINDVSKI